MKIHHFSAASLCPASERLVRAGGKWLARGHMVCHCWLVETTGGLVLVDTGLGLDDLRDVRGRLGRLFAAVCAPAREETHTARRRVEALGFAASDVRDIVVTHLDVDHAGGIPDFPEARVHVHRAELEAARERRTYRERERYRPAHLEGVHWKPHVEDGESWFGFEGVRALGGRDEILLIPLAGHSRGHCGVAVNTGAHWMLHAGDAYFFHGEMRASPACPPGLALFQRLVAVDNELRLHNQGRLRELVRDHGDEVTICSAHCPVELQRMAGAA